VKNAANMAYDVNYSSRKSCMSY